MENNKVQELFTEEHVELIHKGITKAIKKVDFDAIVSDFIEGEFEYASNNCEVVKSIDSMITEVIRQHLVKSGLLKEKNGE